jgi:hypothetical protein
MHLDIAPFEDVRVWIDPKALDDDDAPIGRGHGAIIHCDVTLGSSDIMKIMTMS